MISQHLTQTQIVLESFMPFHRQTNPNTEQTTLKGVNVILYEQVISEFNNLEKQSTQLASELATLPEESFYCVKDDTRTKWYITDKTGTHYLPKANRKLAEELAYKKYLTCKLNEIQTEQNAIRAYLKHHSPNYGLSDQMLSPENRYSELLAPHFAPRHSNTEDFERWSKASYETNPNHRENLIHPTNLGFSVRSKSEAMIAMALHFNCVPFRYESALSLDNITLYPDFTIFHPVTGRIIYWEHFGLIDNPDYQMQYLSKIRHYITNGIYPSIDLITTYETSERPLSLETLDQVISFFALKKQ